MFENKLLNNISQVNCAWTLDRIKSQWIYLGIHTEACITRPETCGAGGGAFSLWLRVIDCGNWRVGIMSSLADETSGFQISCDGRAIRCDVNTCIDLYIAFIKNNESLFSVNN